MMHNKTTVALFVLLMVLTFPASLMAQGQKQVFVEGLGGGLLASVNFDMRFKKDARDGFGARVGYTNAAFVGAGEWVSVFPVGVNFVYGTGRSGLLAGFTTSFGLFPEKAKSWDYRSVIYAAELGYRFRPIIKGVAFQATWSPLFNTVDGTRVGWFGIGVGYAWR